MSNSRIRTVIVDDHEIVRKGLASFLSTEERLEVVAEARNGREALLVSRRLCPDVVVMDLRMPVMGGVEAIGRIAASSSVKSLVLTTYCAPDDIRSALEAGARGAVLKSISSSNLVRAIVDTYKGKRVISADIEDAFNANPPIPNLSVRQRQILESMSRGLTNRDVSVQLDLGLDTVNEYVREILLKIGAANRTEAVSIAVRRGLV